MTQEKEAEIAEIVAQLDAFKDEIEESQARAQTYTHQKSSLEEEKTDLASSLKKNKLEVKKKKEVFKEVEKLQGQDLRVLQSEVAQMNEELQNLRDEWEEYKKPIKEEIYETKQQISDKRVEYQYKEQKIKDLNTKLDFYAVEIKAKVICVQFKFFQRDERVVQKSAKRCLKRLLSKEQSPSEALPNFILKECVRPILNSLSSG